MMMGDLFMITVGGFLTLMMMAFSLGIIYGWRRGYNATPVYQDRGLEWSYLSSARLMRVNGQEMITMPWDDLTEVLPYQEYLSLCNVLSERNSNNRDMREVVGE